MQNTGRVIAGDERVEYFAVDAQHDYRGECARRDQAVEAELRCRLLIPVCRMKIRYRVREFANLLALDLVADR
ncbi:hypothetical protein OG874_18225 [Nocardia sp. NBC_00565]|nr:hypothetical protein [Nocardia sp. NBC_00565]WUC06917.1 hypothetical protein OG874_18225 [Nocardia sp. NBC_00565]